MPMTLKKCVIPVGLALRAMGATAAVYTQTVAGHNGPMTVNVTVDKGAVTAVEVVKHQETQGVGSRAVEQLPAKIVKAHSTKVDALTGATVSSKAILIGSDGKQGQDHRHQGARPHRNEPDGRNGD